MEEKKNRRKDASVVGATWWDNGSKHSPTDDSSTHIQVQMGPVFSHICRNKYEGKYFNLFHLTILPGAFMVLLDRCPNLYTHFVTRCISALQNNFPTQNIIAVSCKCGDGWFNYLLPVVFPNNGDTTSFPAFTTVQLRSRDFETTIVWKPEPLSLSIIMGQLANSVSVQILP